MKLYNTLTRAKDEFAPMGEFVKIYTCGPTVYETASIGNLRAYVFTDVLKKTLNANGYKIYDVMNLTDVGHLVGDGDDGEDKVEKSAREKGLTPMELAKKITEQYFVDCDKINIRRPLVVAPATDYINQMIDFVAALEKLGFTYTISDGVYFDSSRVPTYNKLSRQPIDQNIAGARVAMGEKRNPHDFALWKFVDPKSLQQWPTKWAKHGAPAWHIECSAIAREYLGDTFDIHTGGIDHIPIHHTNEIAQSESLTGKPMANFWMHNEFMTVAGRKMSKSLGNVFSVADIEAKGIDPMALRYLYLLTHYRSILNFTWDALKSAEVALNNLVTHLAKHASAPTNKAQKKTTTNQTNLPVGGGLISPLFDDLNTPMAIAALWDAVKTTPSRDVYDAAMELDTVLSLDLDARVKRHLAGDIIPDDIKTLVKLRDEKKRGRDFAAADKIRNEIATRGYTIRDTKDGTEVKKAK